HQLRRARVSCQSPGTGSPPGARRLGTGRRPPRQQGAAVMADVISVSRPISGTDRTLSFETGKLAPQSQGAVVGRIGDTVVLVTANADKGVREGIDFFPLTVDIEERMYAAGTIPGSCCGRVGRPTGEAILTCRL